MRKRILRDQNGITLVEIIIVIAMIGILASTSVMLIGHLHYADTQKVVQTLDSSLDALQVKTMSKTGKYYMYVYRIDNSYYMQILPDDISGFDASKLTKDGTRLCNSTITIYGRSGGASSEVTDQSYVIKVAYTKSALFDSTSTNVDEIYIDGVPDYTLKLVADTGKHFVNE